MSQQSRQKWSANQAAMLQASSACESLRLMRCDPQQLQEISEQASEWKPYAPRLESLIIDGLSGGPAFRRAPPLHLAHPKSKSMRRYCRPGRLWNSACKNPVIDNLPNLQCERLVCNPLYFPPPCYLSSPSLPF